MAVSESVTRYLREHDAEFDVWVHEPSATAQESARLAHVPGSHMAKGVLLEDGEEFVMAVVPATHQVDLDALEDLLQCDLRVVDESDLPLLFRDCRLGAVPPLGMAYGIPTIVDDALLRQNHVYFEAGDHEALVHVTGSTWYELMRGNQHGRFSLPS